MSSIPYIETVSGYTFFLEGNPVSVDSSDARYTEVVNALKENNMEQLRGILRDNQEAYLLSKISTITQYFNDLKFTITKNSLNDSEEVVSADVSYKGQPLPEVLKQKLIEMYKAGATDFSHLFNFIDNLLANPDKNSREQLYGFLVHKNMPITNNGTFIAYKGVRGDYYSITGNTSTVVLEGKVNGQGHILNEFGKTIRVRHEDVENDPAVGCSQGLHVGSYEYAKGKRVAPFCYPLGKQDKFDGLALVVENKARLYKDGVMIDGEIYDDKKDKVQELYDAMCYIAEFFGFATFSTIS